MRRLTAVLVFSATLFACTNRNKVPAGIIGPDSMRVLMHDLIIADQFVTQYVLKDSATRDVKKESQELYERLFAVHGTTRAGFRKSLDFYSNRPDLERTIFDSLSSSVNKERADIYRGKFGSHDSATKRVADSVAKARARASAPLNPDSLKRVILMAHPGLPMPVLLDSVHLRMKMHAKADSLRLVAHLRDSAATHKADSIRMKKYSDSLNHRRTLPLKPHPRPLNPTK